jgi:hypothetical protein
LAKYGHIGDFREWGYASLPEYIEEKRCREITIMQIRQKWPLFPEYGIFRREK